MNHLTTAGAAEMPEALLNIAREIEALKRECGMDPESPVAIQNGRYMTISHKVRNLAAMLSAAQAELAAMRAGGEEWEIRGQLAAELHCWHRLTGNEAAELVALVTKLAHPQPAAQDAERLDWLLWELPGASLRYVVGELADTSDAAEFRAAIDAAIAAQQGYSHE